MDLQEFRTKAYEILTKNGVEEINGQVYFPEKSVMDALEWMLENLGAMPTSDDEITDRLIAVINSAMRKVKGG